MVNESRIHELPKRANFLRDKNLVLSNESIKVELPP